MKDITVHYCLIDYDQQFAAVDHVCCRKVSCFKMAMPHRAKAHQTVKKIEEMGWELLQHLPYSTDLAQQLQVIFICLDYRTNHLETLNLNMKYSKQVQFIGSVCFLKSYLRLIFLALLFLGQFCQCFVMIPIDGTTISILLSRNQHGLRRKTERFTSYTNKQATGGLKLPSFCLAGISV